MKRLFRNYLLFLVLAAAACTTPGTMDQSGHISGCGGYHTDDQACGNAMFNAPLLAKVHAGMTTDEVRTLMRHDAERREISGNSETWFYMSDYDAERMTAIEFTEGKVTALKQVPWKSKD
jgi:outer membrane protein assembly factor BamE (lipoprotein component of BamABCDE complex)